jgi:hypothetical protein
MIPNAVVASYVLALIAVPVVLIFHLLPTVFAGLAVYILTVKIARRLPVKWGSLSHKLALTILVSCVMLAFSGLAWRFGHSTTEVAGWPLCSQRALKHWKT